MLAKAVDPQLAAARLSYRLGEGRRSRREPSCAARIQGGSWPPARFDTITVSVAGAPRSNEALVVMAIADGGRLRNRCGTEPIP